MLLPASGQPRARNNGKQLKDPFDCFTREIPALDEGAGGLALEMKGRSMNNVYQLGAVKCPLGSKAIHPVFGWCEVVEVNGFDRTIMFEIRHPDETPNADDLPEGVDQGEVLYSETIERITEVVDVRSLREISPQKDLAVRPKATARALFLAK